MCILLVEDDFNDVLLIKRAFRKANIKQLMIEVENGEEAIAYLSREGKYADRMIYPAPLLILLDLKLPRLSGLEVLAWIRKHPIFKRLLVVVLTSSVENSDVDKAYDLGTNSYLVKPMDFQDFVKLVEVVERYWIQHNYSSSFSD